jgi:MbeD/MobD like protein
MDFNPPTSADYARHDASEALAKNRALEERVRTLEQQVNHLQEYVRRIEERLGMRS